MHPTTETLSVKQRQQDRFSDLAVSHLNESEQASLVTLTLSLLEQRCRPGTALSSPDQVRNYLRVWMGEYKNEVFGCLFLDNRHRVLRLEELFQGTIDGAAVYPRVVLQKALECNAAAVVIFHNHPSGVAEPSNADEAITKRLKEALALIDVRVLDHFVVTAGETVSFAERGLI